MYFLKDRTFAIRPPNVANLLEPLLKLNNTVHKLLLPLVSKYWIIDKHLKCSFLCFADTRDWLEKVWIAAGKWADEDASFFYARVILKEGR